MVLTMRTFTILSAVAASLLTLGCPSNPTPEPTGNPTTTGDVTTGNHINPVPGGCATTTGTVAGCPGATTSTTTTSTTSPEETGTTGVAPGTTSLIPQ